MTNCHACAGADLVTFADLGEIPVLCGVHWAQPELALASPVGSMRLAYCPSCGYARNVAFEPDLLVYDTSMDTNLHHSPAFAAFSARLAEHLAVRYQLQGKRVLDIGCGQGDFLRDLCHTGGCTGMGYDAMYAGPPGPDGSGAVFHSARVPEELPEFDLFTCRHWIEHEDDPYRLLARLRERAGDRQAYGYVEVPDASYDLATAGWEVIYPHVSYFDTFALCALARRAGWRIEETGTHFSGMFCYIEISANMTQGGQVAPLEQRDRQLERIAGFAARHHQLRRYWRHQVEQLAHQGKRPVLWGAGSRGVQFLTLADPDQRLAAVVDVNPRKWGRYLPVTAHQVSPPRTLSELDPKAVIITNPAYRDEIDARLRELGVTATLLEA